MADISRQVVKEPFWALAVDETFSLLKTTRDGLSEQEAHGRLQFFGLNAIKEERPFLRLKILFRQLKSPLIFVLILTGILTIFLGQWTEAAVIFAAVLINTALGFYQENKAERAVALLKTYIRVRVRVRRSRGEKEIDAEELVPGDVIYLERGDRVPADARLIFAKDLEADEAILTGESLPTEKDLKILPAATGIAERSSMIFSGTLIVQGAAEAVVTATDKDTELGKIASLVEAKENEPTPLQRSILNFTVNASIILGLLVLALFNAGLYFGYDLLEMVLIAVAVGVSAVPEGLPIALTVILAVGVERLAKKKAVVRQLLAAETLGSTSLILTDKTGTLTQAKMELNEIIPYSVELLTLALLTGSAIVENPDDEPEKWRILGRPLEIALIKRAAREGIFLPKIRKDIKIAETLPFDSQYKYSGLVMQTDSGFRLILFGAPDILLKFTSLAEEDRQRVHKTIDQKAFAGERVLGLASKFVDAKEIDVLVKSRAFQGLEFHGLLTFRDPLRPQAADAIQRIEKTGVKTVIITGDHRGTAEAVARQLKMIDGVGAVLTGDDLNYLSKEELSARANEVRVYARISPEQKAMLVDLYQDKGEIVAVTGDGVNDAPALEAADIGVAIGSGSDVAKNAADLVILDDNYETIVTAIEEGRKIFNNIKKVIVYLLSDTLDELLLIGGAFLMGLAIPINALQILFVNFFSDSFPAIALAFEKGVDDFSNQPRRFEKHLFDKRVKFLILVVGVASSTFLFLLYYFLLQWGFNEKVVRTFIFSSFATYTLFLAFSLRSLEKSIIRYNPFSNGYLVAGALIGLILTLLVIYLPFFQQIFETVSLPLPWLLGVLVVGFFNIFGVEMGKRFL